MVIKHRELLPQLLTLIDDSRLSFQTQERYWILFTKEPWEVNLNYMGWLWRRNLLAWNKDRTSPVKIHVSYQPRKTYSYMADDSLFRKRFSSLGF